MAMSRFNKTITLITLYEPNIRRPQNRVYDLMPSNSKVSSPTIPKLAQNSDCDDSNRLQNNAIFFYHTQIYSFWGCFRRNILSETSPFHACITHILPICHAVWFVVAFLTLQISKVPQQLVKTTSKGEQYERVDEEELNDIDNHTAE